MRIAKLKTEQKELKLQLEASRVINLVPEKDDVFTMFWAAVTDELFNSIEPKDKITKFKTATFLFAFFIIIIPVSF